VLDFIGYDYRETKEHFQKTHKTFERWISVALLPTCKLCLNTISLHFYMNVFQVRHPCQGGSRSRTTATKPTFKVFRASYNFMHVQLTVVL